MDINTSSSFCICLHTITYMACTCSPWRTITFKEYASCLLKSNLMMCFIFTWSTWSFFLSWSWVHCTLKVPCLYQQLYTMLRPTSLPPIHYLPLRSVFLNQLLEQSFIYNLFSALIQWHWRFSLFHCNLIQSFLTSKMRGTGNWHNPSCLRFLEQRPKLYIQQPTPSKYNIQYHIQWMSLAGSKHTKAIGRK